MGDIMIDDAPERTRTPSPPPPIERRPAIDSDGADVAGGQLPPADAPGEARMESMKTDVSQMSYVVSTWKIDQPSKYTRHLEEAADQLGTDLAILLSRWDSFENNPENTIGDIVEAFDKIVEVYNELNEHFQPLMAEKRRRLTPKNSMT